MNLRKAKFRIQTCMYLKIRSIFRLFKSTRNKNQGLNKTMKNISSRDFNLNETKNNLQKYSFKYKNFFDLYFDSIYWFFSITMLRMINDL